MELVYPPVIGFAKGMFRLLALTFPSTGLEQIPTTGGAVLAINHVSYLDFIFAGFAAQPSQRLVRFMAKDAVFHHRVSGPLMRGMHHIPVDREAGAASYRAAVDALRAGELVGVFPEATISRSFTPKQFKTGAVRMAAEAGVPVLPVVVWGGQRIWTKGRPRAWRRHTAISLAVGEPLPVPADADPAELTAELHTRVEALWERTVAAHPDGPDGPDDMWWLPASLGGTAPTPEQARVTEAAEVAERRATRAARDAGPQL